MSLKNPRFSTEHDAGCDYDIPDLEEVIARINNPYAAHIARAMSHLGKVIDELNAVEALMPSNTQGIILKDWNDGGGLNDRIESLSKELASEIALMIPWVGLDPEGYVATWRAHERHGDRGQLSNVLPTVPSLAAEVQRERAGKRGAK